MGLWGWAEAAGSGLVVLRALQPRMGCAKSEGQARRSNYDAKFIIEGS